MHARHHLALLTLLLFAPAAHSADPTPEGARLTVGAKIAPPFVMRGDDGVWSGISVEAWRAAAERAGLSYELVEVELDELFDGVSAGRLDVGIGALTVTAEREERVDFTHAIYSSGLGMGVSLSGGSPLFEVLSRAASAEFARALGALVLVLMAIGVLVWLFERRRNPEQFEGGVKGLLSGFWFSAVTMTTVGYGDKAPVTAGGRIVALVWMFVSIVTISGFTAAIASALTVSNLTSAVDGPEDLPQAVVATVDGTTSDAYLTSLGIRPQRLPSLDDAIAAAADGRAQVVVYDRPLLKYQLLENGEEQVHVLPHVLQRQQYALALAPGSALREALNHALLEHTSGDTWASTLERYLGE